MKLLIDIPKEMSKELKIFKLENDFNTQEQAIIFILKEKFEENEDGGE